MFSHIFVGVTDFDRALHFYDRLFSVLGVEQRFCDASVPELRPQYHRHYFGAYFRDPDGNKLCVACHQPE
jgi:catechol 2,3-dioxygenase-like lactoylglutathione lyase family enzyme